MVVAAAALVALGTLEATESARQLAGATLPLRLAPGTAGLTALGSLASAAVLLGLGAFLGNDRDAVRLGAFTGVLAGAAGGTIRAFLIATSVTEAVGRYALVPDWYVPVALAVFVGTATAATAVAGGALAFAGARLSRAWRRRPPA